MPDVRQQATQGKRDLPSLPKRVTGQWMWLLIAGILASAVILDLRRDPSDQLGACLYVKAVRGYQQMLRPWLRGRVRCRYRPSCSEYSIEAVKTHGLCAGIRLTVSRICSCRRSVPFGTYDPVPAREIDLHVVHGGNHEM